MHTPYLAAEEKCNEVCSLRSQTCTILLVIFPFVLGPHQSINKQLPQVGGYLADVLDGDENNFIKSVLNVINPKVTTSTNSLLDVGVEDISYDVGRN